MSLEQEKMTDPLSLVGANEEQSPYNLTQEIITNEEKLGNNNLDDMLKLLAEYEASDEYQQFLEKSKPGYMETLTMNNLYEHVSRISHLSLKDFYIRELICLSEHQR